MKAKKVYEFKRTRKQGLSKQTEIGTKIYYKNKAIKWFKERSEEQYWPLIDLIEVDDEYNIIFDSKNVDLEFIEVQLNEGIDNKFPYKIIANNVSIDFEGKLTYIDIDYKTNRTLTLDFNNNLQEIHGNIETRYFVITDETISKVTAKLTLGQFENEYFLGPISTLPDNLEVKGMADIDYENFIAFGDNIYINNLYINNPNFQYFGKNNKFGTIHLGSNSIEEIPDDLVIENSLNIETQKNPHKIIIPEHLKSKVKYVF